MLATKFGLVSHSGGGPGVLDSSPANFRSAAASLTVGGRCYFWGTKSMMGRTSQVPSQPGQFLMCSSMNSFALASASS